MPAGHYRNSAITVAFEADVLVKLTKNKCAKADSFDDGGRAQHAAPSREACRWRRAASAPRFLPHAAGRRGAIFADDGSRWLFHILAAVAAPPATLGRLFHTRRPDDDAPFSGFCFSAARRFAPLTAFRRHASARPAYSAMTPGHTARSSSRPPRLRDKCIAPPPFRGAFFDGSKR